MFNIYIVDLMIISCYFTQCTAEAEDVHADPESTSPKRKSTGKRKRSGSDDAKVSPKASGHKRKRSSSDDKLIEPSPRVSPEEAE